MRLKLEQEGDWVCCVCGFHPEFVNFLKYSVTPATYRRYDQSKTQWLVHWKKLPLVASAIRRYFDEVDWSALPDAWQIYLVGGSAPAEKINEETPKISPHEVLFVTEDAPLEVIRASYYVLAEIYHPDHGGDSEKMIELTEAYDQIRQRFIIL